jgi:uncharacterized repeat protein (TIGR01451 family)
MGVRKLYVLFLACAATAVLVPGWPAMAGEAPEQEELVGAGSLGLWYTAGSIGPDTVNEYTNMTPLVVPDNQCTTGWVSSVINVPDTFFIADVNVGIWMTHTYRGDVEIQLRAPDGTAVLLIGDLGGSADNINALFDDSAPGPPDAVSHTAPPPYYTDHPWTPVQPLAAFRGVTSAGDWTLEVCDDAGGDTGTLEQWTLFMETDVVVLDPPAQGENGCPGDTLSYDLTVLNGTTTAQPFALSYTGNLWTANGPGTTASLATGDAELISFTHDVPPGALVGDADTVTVTATGTVSNSATATTSVPLIAGWGDLSSLNPLHATRFHGAVYYGGKIYKIGGDNGSAQAWVDIYDIATDTWSSGADMPGPRRYIDCAEIGGKIYCGGGYTTSGQTTLYIYDIAANTWSTGASLATYRYDYGAVALDGKYYMIGGYTPTYTNTIIAYDPVTNTWDTTLPTMSVGRRNPNAGVIGGKIYVISGRSAASTYLASGEVYDPVANAWSPIASMPVSSWLMGADQVIGNRFLIMAGGYFNSTATASIFAWAYDALNDSYTLLPNMEHLLYGGTAASDGTTFWVVSGRISEGGSFRYSEYLFRAYTCADRTDLAVTKDDGVTEVVAGLPVTYTITAINNGPSPARHATVFDDFPGLVAVTWSCVATGTGTCTPAGIDAIDDSVSLGVGDTVTYTATGTVDPGATGTLDNTVIVNLGTVPDLVPADNEATDSDLVTLQADLEIVKDDGLLDATLGETVTYTIGVSNPGPSDALGSLVEDLFPPVLIGATWTCSGLGGGVCGASGSGDIADLADLPAGGSVTYTATAIVGFTAPAGPFDNTATVTPAIEVVDPDPLNNTATDTTTVVFADLEITKDDGVTQVAPGDPVTYTIVATNNGPNDVFGGRVTDTFVADLLNVTWTCIGGGGAICTPAGMGDILDVVLLPVGGTVTYTVQATVDPNAQGIVVEGRPALVNTALVFGNVDVADPDLANNAATDVDTIQLTDVDLAISKTDDSCYALPGSNTTYTITVTNSGPAAAVDAEVLDSFPPEITAVSWTCVGAGGASCTANGIGDIDDTVSVPVLGSVTYTAVATIDGAATGYLVNTATVAPAIGITDLDLTNNTAFDSSVLELPMFCDGFESGNTDAWSSVVP